MHSRRFWGGVSLVIFLCVSGLTTGCQHRNSEDGVFFGTAEPVGNGNARTWVQYENNQPVALGVRFSETSLDGLPGRGTHDHSEYVLKFPEEAADLPFTHVAVNWNPQGHEPEGLYTIPHFDVHFYMITEEERKQISPADPRFQEKIDREPSQPFIPVGYISAKDAVPHMGRHWADANAPEFHGERFTHTMIFGSYDGRVVFLEPMVTREFLAAKAGIRRPIPWPERFEKQGYYPTEYSIQWNPETREHIVALEKIRMSE